MRNLAEEFYKRVVKQQNHGEEDREEEYWNPTSRCRSHSPVISSTSKTSFHHSSKYLGYLDLTKNIVALISVGFLASLIHSDKKTLEKYCDNDADLMDFLYLSPTAQMTIFATVTVLLTITVLMTILLLQGIYEMDSQKILIWFIYQLFVFVISTIFHSCLVLILWVLPPRPTLQPSNKKRYCAHILSVVLFINYYWVGYQSYIINSLLKEIRKERKSWRHLARGNYDIRDCSRNGGGIIAMITSSPDSGWNEDVEYLV